MMRTFLITFVILILLGAGGWFGYNAMFPQYHIVRTYRTGETWEYVINMDMSSPQGSISTPFKMTVKTIKVHSDGSADIEKRFTVGKGADPRMAAQFKSLDGLKLKVRSDKYSRDTVIQGDIAGQIMNTAQSTDDIYPVKPVRKGEEWERTTSRDGMEAKAIHKIVGTEQFNGRECYKITSKINTASGSVFPAEGTVTSYIDRETGWITKSSASMKMTINGMNITILTDTAAKRIASGKPAPPKKQPVNKK